ncbi:MAG TPA: HIT domain-containing protein [Candidatus Omnitrophota bacterium]|nr:HIT domain-containing protein [Candidatus Omnitrophota bacterium]HPD83905.1 HIT domain-containing protein [Candidatus Omnitrophota bacterium]HRZ02762.1 HIT domain-containing protein [Candidatus Omnitrophota bacterium]
MDKLWAPWRVKYITGLSKKQKGCIFCKISRDKKDSQNYVISRSKHSFSVLNIYPYNNGHILVVPYRHVGDFVNLNKEEKEDLWGLLETTKKLLDKALKPCGYNVGMNIGKMAGAGFPNHIHIHIVPRWNGDVNFMPVTGNTKVISQSLQALLKRLKKCK